MLFRLMLASLIGGLATLATLWSQGATVALVCAPFGGSAAALVFAVAVAGFGKDEEVEEVPPPRRPAFRVPDVAPRVQRV